jgi:uncharacterized protein
MDNKKAARLEFPLVFPLKIIGKNEDDFEAFVIEIVRRYFPDLLEENIVSRLSSGDRYISVSVKFWAEDREQVDALCAELGNHKRVMTLL